VGATLASRGRASLRSRRPTRALLRAHWLARAARRRSFHGPRLPERSAARDRAAAERPSSRAMCSRWEARGGCRSSSRDHWGGRPGGRAGGLDALSPGGRARAESGGAGLGIVYTRDTSRVWPTRLRTVRAVIRYDCVAASAVFG